MVGGYQTSSFGFIQKGELGSEYATLLGYLNVSEATAKSNATALVLEHSLFQPPD